MNDCLDRSVFVMDMGAAGCLPGDDNGDGTVNGRDIAVLVNALFDSPCPSATVLCALDTNDDLVVDESDIAGFVDAIPDPFPYSDRDTNRYPNYCSSRKVLARRPLRPDHDSACESRHAQAVTLQGRVNCCRTIHA